MTTEETTLAEKMFIERLQKIMNKKPKRLWLFNNGCMFVMKGDKEGNPIMKSDAVDSDHILTTIKNVHSEGGDW